MAQKTVQQAKELLKQSVKYIAKGLESGAYASTVGGDLFAERLYAQINRFLKASTSRLADARDLLKRAAQYISKGLEMGSYAETVGGDLFAERLLGHINSFTNTRSRQHATRKKSPAQLDREIAEELEAAALTPAQRRYREGRRWGWPADLAFKVALERPLEGARSPWKPRGR